LEGTTVHGLDLGEEGGKLRGRKEKGGEHLLDAWPGKSRGGVNPAKKSQKSKRGGKKSAKWNMGAR